MPATETAEYDSDATEPESEETVQDESDTGSDESDAIPQQNEFWSSSHMSKISNVIPTFSFDTGIDWNVDVNDLLQESCERVSYNIHAKTVSGEQSKKDAEERLRRAPELEMKYTDSIYKTYLNLTGSNNNKIIKFFMDRNNRPIHREELWALSRSKEDRKKYDIPTLAAIGGRKYQEYFCSNFGHENTSYEHFVQLLCIDASNMISLHPRIIELSKTVHNPSKAVFHLDIEKMNKKNAGISNAIVTYCREQNKTDTWIKRAEIMTFIRDNADRLEVHPMFKGDRAIDYATAALVKCMHTRTELVNSDSELPSTSGHVFMKKNTRGHWYYRASK